MPVKIKLAKNADMQIWDRFVYAHPRATLYHLFGWKNVIEKSYGHKTYYMMAINNQTKEGEKNQSSSIINPESDIKENSNFDIAGIFPLVHIKSLFFGNSLISVPFFDYGGILAETKEDEEALFLEGMRLGKKLLVDKMEIRSADQSIDDLSFNELKSDGFTNSTNFRTKTRKVRMIFCLPESSDVLFKSFKSKLRNQIRKPLKEGLIAKVGAVELLDDFYSVFSRNMRDLGSPVHSKTLIYKMLKQYSEQARTIVVYKDNKPVSGSIVCGFRDILENPWASSIRKYSKLSPNMLLYWTMLEYACNHKFKQFDFGRSSPNEGTFKFKKQWGAKAIPLNWKYVSLNGKNIAVPISRDIKFEIASRFWQKLPVSVTKIIGPPIRKKISL
jgi:serine/alanine adding enzyme